MGTSASPARVVVALIILSTISASVLADDAGSGSDAFPLYMDSDKAVVNYSVGTGADANAGIIGITGDGPKSNGFPTTVYVNSCVKIPCNPGENRIHSTLTF